MADPAQSLFCGVELQLDTVDQQEREQEEEEAEEAARLEANLAEKMQGAFDAASGGATTHHSRSRVAVPLSGARWDARMPRMV